MVDAENIEHNRRRKERWLGKPPGQQALVEGMREVQVISRQYGSAGSEAWSDRGYQRHDSPLEREAHHACCARGAIGRRGAKTDGRDEQSTAGPIRRGRRWPGGARIRGGFKIELQCAT